MALGLVVLCDVACSRVESDGRFACVVARVSSAGLGIYVLQVPVRAIQRHLYDLGDPVANLVLVPAMWFLLLGLALLFDRVPRIRSLMRIKTVDLTRHKREVHK